MVEHDGSKGRIRDARGRLVTQLDPVALHVLHRHQVIESEPLAEIVEDLEPGTARLRRYAIVLVPGAVLLVAGGIAALYVVSDAGARQDLISTLTNPALMVPNLVCCCLVPWMVARQARMKRVRFAMLKHRRCPHCGYDLRRCPHCGYDLRGLPTDPADQATVCPECGCAWVLDERANSERLAATAPAAMRAGSRGTVTMLTLMLVGLTLLGILGTVMFLRR
jgi:hypothetical protein